jgi:hypothetical protein
MNKKVMIVGMMGLAVFSAQAVSQANLRKTLEAVRLIGQVKTTVQEFPSTLSASEKKLTELEKVMKCMETKNYGACGCNSEEKCMAKALTLVNEGVSPLVHMTLGKLDASGTALQPGIVFSLMALLPQQKTITIKGKSQNYVALATTRLQDYTMEMLGMLELTTLVAELLDPKPIAGKATPAPMKLPAEAQPNFNVPDIEIDAEDQAEEAAAAN